MDWKDILLAKSEEMGIAPSPKTDSLTTETDKKEAFDVSKHPALNLVMERKGRGGKTAIIIEGFVCDDSQLKKIASTLKSALGTGGSARGGEILIQGDCRDRVRAELKTLGFKIKG